jgi:redox-sensitive bicupin YhaK (pirin superfamily)
MTAGSGIIHQEMPKGDADGAMHGFQLWANLPAEQKMMAPRYRDITADRIPVVELQGGITVKVIAGALGGARGPMDDIVIDPEYLDCTVPPGETFVHPTDPAYTAFIYVIGGSGQTDGHALENGKLVLFDEGEQLAVGAADEPLRFLLLTGKPLNEPVAWRGPIVMNTQAELEAAFREYREGTFIKNQ